jgi:two-component system NarL family sensor kinase
VVAAGGCGLLLVAAAGLAWAALEWSLDQAVDAFVVSNLVIGASFSACGALIAWFRPRHPVGWAYLVGGQCQLLSAACAPVIQLALDHRQPGWLVRLLVTVFGLAWPINIGVTLPLSLLLLPDGRLPSPRWRPWFLLSAATAPLFILENAATAADGTTPDGFIVLPRTAAGGWCGQSVRPAGSRRCCSGWPRS